MRPKQLDLFPNTAPPAAPEPKPRRRAMRPKPLGMFPNTAPAPPAASPKPRRIIVGDARPPCCGNDVAEIIETPQTQHAAKLICVSCCRFRGWVKRDVFVFINSVCECFGADGLPTLKELASRAVRGSR